MRGVNGQTAIRCDRGHFVTVSNRTRFGLVHWRCRACDALGTTYDPDE